MKLTREQQNIMDGKKGELLQRAFSCLVRYGEAMDADAMIPVTSSHTVISSLQWLAMILSKPGTEINQERIAQVVKGLSKIRVNHKTTTQSPPEPAKCPPTKGAYPIFYQLDDTIEVIRNLGMEATLTCTPYLIGNMPTKGETCSWCESSAISFVNSVCGAHTNRDGLESSFFSAITGFTPRWGLHLAENRKGTHLIKVECELNSVSDWGTLGYYAGKFAGVGVPVYVGLRRPSGNEIKQLCAAGATSGGIALFHIPGITPEASSVEDAFKGSKPVATGVFTEAMKNEIYENLSSKPGNKVGAVCIGCPHASLSEIEEIAQLIKGKHVSPDTALWIGTDFHTRVLAERQGAAQVIEAAGGQFIGKCIITTNTDMSSMIMATNHIKLAHYTQNYLQSKVVFADLKRCIDMAVKGVV